MITRRLRTQAIAGIFLALPLQASAQRAAAPRPSADHLFHSGNVALTLSAGGAAFTDFRRDEAQLAPPDGLPLPFTRRVAAQTTLTGAASLQLWLNRIAAIRVQTAWVPTRFSVSIRDSDAPSSLDTTRYSRLDIWLYDASLLLRPPVALGRVAPYVILGAGAINYRVKDGAGDLPPEAAAAFRDSNRLQWAGNLGVGAVLPLQRDNLLLSFELTDHFTRTPLGDEGRELIFDTGGTAVGSDAGSEPDAISLASTVRLTVGLTIPVRLR